jgi:hypothetical protein
MLQTFPSDTNKQSSPTTKTINLNFLDSLGNHNHYKYYNQRLLLLLLLLRFI